MSGRDMSTDESESYSKHEGGTGLEQAEVRAFGFVIAPNTDKPAPLPLERAERVAEIGACGTQACCVESGLQAAKAEFLPNPRQLTGHRRSRDYTTLGSPHRQVDSSADGPCHVNTSLAPLWVERERPCRSHSHTACEAAKPRRRSANRPVDEVCAGQVCGARQRSEHGAREPSPGEVK